MPTGKACSQAGHAYLGAFQKSSPERQAAYHADGIGTKICLTARHQGELEKFAAWAEANGHPHCLVVDSGRNTTFGGVPTTSALGIGPLTAEEARPLRKLQLLS
jgi:peptidyl-tRNA hydrolase, PTH2 family